MTEWPKAVAGNWTAISVRLMGMEIEHIITLVALTATVAVVYLGCWAASLKTGKKSIQVAGTKVSLVALIPIVMLGIAWGVNDAGPPDFQQRVPGPATGTGSTLREVRFPVNDWRNGQEVELTMIASEVAKGNLNVPYLVQGPDGKELANAEQVVQPAAGANWQPIRFQFASERSGDHKLLVEIPAGVDMMKIVVKEEK